MWLVDAGGTGDDEGFDIAFDSAENAYVVGVFTDTATFHGATGPAITVSGDDYNVQNSPIVLKLAEDRLEGWLTGSAPDAVFRIEFFTSSSFGPDGAGEAEQFLGSLTVRTDSQGQAVFDVPYTPPSDKPFITATATDSNGSTSELSHLRQAALHAPGATVRLRPGQSRVFYATSGDAIALRDRTHALLSAQSSGNETDTVGAAKRLHVAIRQAQAGAQWERDRLLSTLSASVAKAA